MTISAKRGVNKASFHRFRRTLWLLILRWTWSSVQKSQRCRLKCLGFTFEPWTSIADSKEAIKVWTTHVNYVAWFSSFFLQKIIICLESLYFFCVCYNIITIHRAGVEEICFFWERAKLVICFEVGVVLTCTLHAIIYTEIGTNSITPCTLNDWRSQWDAGNLLHHRLGTEATSVLFLISYKPFDKHNLIRITLRIHFNRRGIPAVKTF